jgi:hypothetical protein
VARTIAERWRSGGPQAAWNECIQIGASAVRWYRPALRRRRNEISDFDIRFNVDTSGVVKPTDLTIDSDNYLHAQYYRPTIPSHFRELMDEIDISAEHYTFVDCGSGKGRILLLASEFPFREVIGIEFAEELHRLAEENIRRYNNPSQQCRSIRSICMDVVHYMPPETPLVIYLFDPFGEPIIRRMIENLEGSYRKNPRDIIVLYYRPAQRALFDSSKVFSRMRETDRYIVYRTSNGDGSPHQLSAADGPRSH